MNFLFHAKTFLIISIFHNDGFVDKENKKNLYNPKINSQ